LLRRQAPPARNEYFLVGPSLARARVHRELAGLPPTFALPAGIFTFDLSRYMCASLTMIDRHDGHFARDGREHAIRLLDEHSANVRGDNVLGDGTARSAGSRRHPVEACACFSRAMLSQTTSVKIEGWDVAPCPHLVIL